LPGRAAFVRLLRSPLKGPDLPPLRHRQIFDFYWPLVLTSQMMTLAHPIINAALGRSADPIVQLAAYGVGFGLAVFLNSPLFPFQQIVASMGVGPQARRDLIGKGMVIGAVISALDFLIALSPGGDELIMRLMGSSPQVASLAQKVILVQAPIPLLLPLRSYYWGIVLRHRNTRIISQATGLRLVGLAIILFTMMGLGWMPPVVMAGAGLTLAILIETVYSAFRAKRLLRRDASGINGESDERVGWSPFLDFIGPLMVSTVTWSAMRPIINAIVGRTSDPDLAQGGFGFVFPLLILMASPLFALQNTTLVLVRDRRDLRQILRFSAATILVFVSFIGIWVWTPLRDLLLLRVFSLEPDKAIYVATAMMLIPYQPIPMGARSVSQGFLMNRRRTRVIAAGGLLKTLLIVMLGFAAVWSVPSVNGAILGTVLVMIGGSLETLIVSCRARRLHFELIEASDAARDDPGP